MKRLAIIAATTLLALATTTTTADAATVVKLDLDGLVAHSDAIVVAEVLDKNEQLEEDGRVYTTVTFETTERIAGDPGKHFELRHVGGRDGDVATRAPGMPRFDSSQRVLLFLKTVDDRPILTGLTQGTFQVAVGPDGQTDFVIPQVHPGHLVAPDEAPDRVDTSETEDFDPDSHEQLFGRAHAYSSFLQQIERRLKADREADR